MPQLASFCFHWLLHTSLCIKDSTWATFKLEYITAFLLFLCDKEWWLILFLLLILWNAQTHQCMRNHLHISAWGVSPQIKSLFNLSYHLTIVMKHLMEKASKNLEGNDLNFFIRLLAFSVSKCNAFIEKDVTSCPLHHFLWSLTCSVNFMLSAFPLCLWGISFSLSNFWLVFSKIPSF